MSESLTWSALASALLSFLLVGAVRLLALRHDVLDHPGERSSHTVATPRGGGLGLLIAALGLWVWQAVRVPTPGIFVIVFGASVVALIGWADDRRGLPVRTRLAVHALAAALIGWIAARWASTPSIAVLLFVAWTFWTVSSINLVNFMDGINGLVASQIAIFALSLAWSFGRTNVTPFYAITLAAACIGFLPWNFPRARIFLGDVGSGGLGYLVPALALLAMRDQGSDVVGAHLMREQGTDVLHAHLPLLPLFGDAVTTIVRRWRRGERLTEAHRSHLYQRLANGPLSHTIVTVIYAAVSVCGMVAAHLDRSSRTAIWLLIYVALTLVLGVALDRFATTATRASG